MRIDWNRWQARCGVAAFVFAAVSGGGWAVYDHFAKADDLVTVADRTDKNQDAGFRLEQMIINNTRIQQQERGYNPNAEWIKQQQRNLDYRRCLARQAKDKRVRCDK